MVKVMDPPAAVDDAEISGDKGAVTILHYATDTEEADGLTQLVCGLIKDDGAPPSEIAILVSREQQFFCQSLIAAFEAAGVPYREEDSSQDLASEPVARLIVDFLLVVSGKREATAHRRLLDQIVFNYGYDEEHEYQQRSRWSRLITETRRQISSNTINLKEEKVLHALIETLLKAVGRDKIVAMSSDYAHGDRLDQLIADTLERVHALLSAAEEPAVALASFSGDEAVRIMSIHKSKGLEFETVIILGVENQTFWGGLPQERSVYFVGISRAKAQLFLTHCDQRRRPKDFPRPRWDVHRTPQVEFLNYAVVAG